MLERTSAASAGTRHDPFDFGPIPPYAGGAGGRGSPHSPSDGGLRWTGSRFRIGLPATARHWVRPRRRCSMTPLDRPSPGDPTGLLAEIGASLAARPYARRGVSVRDQSIRVILVDDHTL